MTRIVSYSELLKWDTCPRQYYYNFELGLRTREESEALTIGAKGHKLLQFFYTALQEGFTKDRALKKTQERAEKLINTESITEISGLLKAWGLVSNYIRETEFTSDVILVENRFVIPLVLVAPIALIDEYGLHDVEIGFTPDVVFQRKGGFCDVEDAKFVGRAWSSAKLNRFPQAKIYQILLKKMKYNVTNSAIRFFNTQTSLISVRNYTLTPAAEVILIRDLTKTIAEVMEYRKLPATEKTETRRTMNYPTCQGCSFEFACTLEAEGKDATPTFKAQFVKSTYDYRS